MSRLSFRAKLLLVLFVPFLALVVVAAAGLSDRFTALHAQEQYGDLSAPLRSLDAASRALQNESVVSSWYVAGTTAPPTTELNAARARTDVAVRAFRANEQAFADAGLSPAAGARARGHEQGTRRHRGGAGPGRRPRRRCRDDARLLPRRRRATSSTSASGSLATSRAPTSPPASPGCSRSSARNTSWPAKRACTSRCSPSGGPNDFSEWVGAQTTAARYRDLFTNAATDAELQAYQAVMGAPAAPAPLPAAFRDRGADAGRVLRAVPAAVAAARPGDRPRSNSVINAAASADAAAALRDTRLYGGAAVFAMLLTLMLIWFVVAGGGRAGAPPHRRRARDVAAPAPGSGRVAPHRWRRRARCSRPVSR